MNNRKGHQGHNARATLVRVRPLVSIAPFVMVLVAALPVRAELVFFSSGRSLSVKSHHTEGGSLVLLLRGGGEIVCEP